MQTLTPFTLGPPAVRVPARSTGRWLSVGLLIAVLLAGGWLRIAGLREQGTLFYDAASYVSEGRFLATAAVRFWEYLSVSSEPLLLPRLLAAARDLQEGVGGHPPQYARPGHALLIGLSMLIFGMTPYAGAVVSAVSGLLTVALTYVLGRRYWSAGVGLLAAALLAMSAQHVFYSRESLSEADAALFTTAAALAYLRSLDPHARVRWALLSGLLLGLALACNIRLWLGPLLLLPALAAHLRREAGWRAHVQRVGALAAGFALPLLAIQAGYVLARRLAKSAGARYDWMDMVDQWIRFSGFSVSEGLTLDQLATYPYVVWTMDGPLFLLLLAVGLVVVVRRGQQQDVLLASFLLIPVVIYSLHPTGEARMRFFSAGLPWAALAAAVGARWLSGHVRRSFGRVGAGVALAALVGLVAVQALPRSRNLAAARSGLPAVRAYLDTVGSDAVLSTNGPVTHESMPGIRTNAHGPSSFVRHRSDLIAAKAEGLRYLLVDTQAYVTDIPEILELTEEYEEDVPPVFQAVNTTPSWYWAALLEHNGIHFSEWGANERRYARWVQHATSVRLYPLDELLHRELRGSGA